MRLALGKSVPQSQLIPQTRFTCCHGLTTGHSVQLLPSASTSTSAARSIGQLNVLSLSFSPQSTTLFTYERPVKSDTEVHKNVKAWSVTTAEKVGAWYQKTHDDWFVFILIPVLADVVNRVPIITADESHLFRQTASDILIFSPPLTPRPSTRLKLDGTIKALFLSTPTSLPAETTSSKPLPAHSEAALAVWIGERNGAPASVALYPLSSLIGGGGDAEKTENRDMPMTTARKAFYQADKLTVKWNAAGTMVRAIFD